MCVCVYSQAHILICTHTYTKKKTHTQLVRTHARTNNTHELYAPPWGLSSLAKELPATASVMQSSSKELSTLVADRV